MALWFLNASTWMGRHGIYLEDLYVRPGFRGLGLGLSLVSGVMKLHKGTLLLEDNAPGLKASLVLPAWRE